MHDFHFSLPINEREQIKIKSSISKNNVKLFYLLNTIQFFTKKFYDKL
jgi:hypothetical protein